MHDPNAVYGGLMSKQHLPNDAFHDPDIAKRRDAALLRALSTPHKRQSEMKVGGQRRSAAGHVHVLGGGGGEREGGSEGREGKGGEEEGGEGGGGRGGGEGGRIRGGGGEEGRGVRAG